MEWRDEALCVVSSKNKLQNPKWMPFTGTERERPPNSFPNANSICLHLPLQFSPGVANWMGSNKAKSKAENTSPCHLKCKYFYLQQAWTKHKRWMFLYLIANSMNLVNPSLARQGKRENKEESIALIKLSQNSTALSKKRKSKCLSCALNKRC